jgi:hypothetical protein
MQWKPIANKYRKGTMKSTLQARMLILLTNLLVNNTQHTRSKGSERESEIAYTKNYYFF